MARRRRDRAELVHLGGVYRLRVGEGLNFKVLHRQGPLWRVVWLNGSGFRADLTTVQITACSEHLRGGSPVPAYR